MERARPTPASRAAAAALGTYFAMGVLGLIGAFIGPLVPCSGKLCELGRVFEGAAVGMVLGLVLAALLAHRLGLRWWFVPTILGVAVVSFVLARSAEGTPLHVLLSLVVAAPIIAALVSPGFSPRGVAIGLAVLALVIALIAVVLKVGDERDHRRHQERQAERFRATDVPLYAPTHIDDAEVRLVVGDEDLVMYDLSDGAHDGWLRVVLDPSSERCEWSNHTDLGDGLKGLGNGPEHRRVCLALPDVTVEFWPDGGSSDWTSQDMVDAARGFHPVDAQWLIERAN